MRSREIYVPLFTELSTCVDSPFFHVFPGQIAILQGFGFSCHCLSPEKKIPGRAPGIILSRAGETFSPDPYISMLIL